MTLLSLTSSFPFLQYTQIKGDMNPFDADCCLYFYKRKKSKMLVTLKGRKSLLYLWEKQGRKCPICGEPIDTHKAWNVMPTVQNGKNAICWFMMNVLNYPANQMETRSSLSRSLHTNRGLEKLEPYEGKLSRTVLRGGIGSNADLLPDQTVENKQKFISQIMTSKSPVRSCEDVDETALSYAEIKALCAGDERIKEKMDLDVDVARLKLMKASHQSQQFRLEDNLLRHFPEQIRQNESFVEGFTADMQTLSAHPHPVDGFAGMEVKGDLLTDKDNAGAAILEAFKDAKGLEPVPIGSYRGFSMSLTVEDFGRDFILTLKGKMNHRVTLGKDARGNLTRIDNTLNAMPDRLQNVRNTLDALTAQMETAKAELGKPFPQEDELRTKSARLAELNAELNIDDRTPMEQMAEDAPAVQSAKAERPSVLAKLKAPLSQPCADDKIRHRNKEER